MTAQPPLPLNPRDARPVGVAAAIAEDDAGGRVFVHGNLAYAWDGGDRHHNIAPTEAEPGPAGRL